MTYTIEQYVQAIRDNLPVIVDDMTDGSVYQRNDEDCMGFHETNFRVSLSNGAVIQFTVKELVEPDEDEDDEYYIELKGADFTADPFSDPMYMNR